MNDAMNKNESKRPSFFSRKYIVDKQLQYRILINFIICGLSVCLISLTGFYIFLKQVSGVIELIGPEFSQQTSELITIWQSSFRIVIALVVLNILAIWFYGLLYSNRIAGPVYRMIQVLDKNLSGDTTERVKIRKDDYFHELAEKINSVLEKSKPS